ncbi:alpha/beta hydrolase [Nocardioides sp.]|uniref:alpha/beta hydrolase n=1 Tax=Nocardioides sp. TaxID=35761 RepID=UPI0027359A5D|nr:alpha/beta hydrolase [Nocardioides sp.]MDP3891938.1 alpha/beta hydrolase [Nocardioides sp.]
MSLDPGLASMLDFMSTAGYPPLHEGSPEVARKAMRALIVDAVQPADVVPVDSVADLSAGGVPARVYRPSGDGPFPTVLFFHGGGFVIGDLDTHDQFCRRLCRGTSSVVVSVDYRLAPEHPFPAGVEDALAAAAWAADHLDELGGGPVLAVAGDSAGGNLSTVVAQAMPERVAAQLLIYPATDAFGDYPSRVENAAGYFLEMDLMVWFFGHYLTGVTDVVPDDVRHSPLQAPSLAGQPPAVVVTAEFDPLRDEGEAYAAALAATGVSVDSVRYDGLIHGFIDMGPFSPACVAAVDDLIGRFAALLR